VEVVGSVDGLLGDQCVRQTLSGPGVLGGDARLVLCYILQALENSQPLTSACRLAEDSKYLLANSYIFSSNITDVSTHPQGNHKRIEMSLTELTHPSSTIIIILTIHPHQIESNHQPAFEPYLLYLDQSPTCPFLSYPILA
jgi:hypothetical protein